MRFPKKLRPKRKLIITLIVLAVLAAGAGVVIKILSSPASGTVTNAQATQAKQEKPAPTALTLKGKHFTFTYNSDYSDLTDISHLDPAALEQWRLMAKQSGTSVISISIHKPSSGLGNDSSLKLRRSRPAEYTESKTMYGNLEAIVMTKKDGSESTAFLAKAPYVATIVATSTSLTRQPSEMLTEALGNFKWTD